MTKVAPAFVLAALVACGGGNQASPESPQPDDGDATPVAAGEVLTVAPFVLTVTGTRSDGTRQVRVYRGSADGVLSAERDGETREVARVSSDGTFTPLEPGRGALATLSADGTFVVNGQPLPGRVDADGTVYRGDQPLLKIENGAVVFLLDELKSSKVVANGEVVSETTWEMTVEGGDEVRRLVGAVLLLQMAGGGAESSESSNASQEAEVAPAPAPEPGAP